ncbi:hypothetical protein GBAR_LOCUS21788 [Geodia barretti]|uniref:Innexin n=1 Tax=Geodia barretti TaxID=519541 RepID=A0AA35WZ15_GEOBA|nr:hypothetical protein GBAR_LOCUS21788 [Geodia barretti]
MTELASNTIASLPGAQPGPSGGKGEKSSSDEGSDVSIQPKDFFWDQSIKYLSSIMALLTVLDVTLQFFRGGGPICMVPGTIEGRDNVTLEVTRDQAAFINTLCQRSLSRAEYYPFFVLIQGVVLVAPHFIWEALFLGQFDFFFSIVRQLDRLRSRDTGKYREKNFDIIKKIDMQFGEKIIFPCYILKLIMQVTVVFASMIVNEAVFQNSYFSFTYECSVSINPPPQGWLLPFDVSCVYSSFRLYEKLKYINLSLLFFALLLILYAIFWCMTRHVEALGSKDVAQFAFESGLRPTDYVEERFWSNDMDFLIMRLFRADPGHGYVFKDIQVFSYK